MPRTNGWTEVVLGPATSPISDIRIWHISQGELALKSPSFPHPPHLQFEVVLEIPNPSMWHMWFQPLSCKPAAIPKMQLDQTKTLMQFILKGEKPNKWILSYCFSCNLSGQVCTTGLIHFCLLWLTPRTHPARSDPAAPCHAPGSSCSKYKGNDPQFSLTLCLSHSVSRRISALSI